MEPSIFSILLRQVMENTIQPGIGPCAIILCDNMKQLEVTVRSLENLNCATHRVSIHVLRETETIEKQQKDIEGCPLLVSTLFLVDKLLDQKPEFLCLKRLEHLAILNIDRILWSRELKYFLKPFYSCNLQLVCTSNSWNNQILRIVRRFREPVICFGSMIEVAIFARTDFVLKFHEEPQKFDTIVEILREDDLNSVKTAVICSKHEEYDVMCKVLTSSKIPFATNNNSPTEGTVLVLTESDYLSHKIADVRHVIHLSMPSVFNKVSKRFSLMAESYKNRLATKTTFLANDHCLENLLTLMELLEDRLPQFKTKEITHVGYVSIQICCVLSYENFANLCVDLITENC